MEEEKKKLKKSVRIRLLKEEQKSRKEDNEGQQGAAMASLNNIPSSPRKMRLVADLVRGRRVFEALNMLRFEPKVGARSIEQLLRSAIANWENKNQDLNIEDADLYIKEIYVNGGKMLKRLRPAPQGRGHRIRKRSNHVTMIVDSLNKPEDLGSVDNSPESQTKNKSKSEKS